MRETTETEKKASGPMHCPLCGIASSHGRGEAFLARLLKIHQMVASGEYPSMKDISAAIEVSRKTLYRDLDFLRDRLGLPLEYDQQKYGWFYTESPESRITELITGCSLFLSQLRGQK